MHTLCTLRWGMYAHRWLKEWKINLASEAKERVLAKKLVGPNLKAEMVAFSFSLDGGAAEEVRMAPLAYIPDLIGKVKQLLEQSDKYVQDGPSQIIRLV